MLLQLLIHLSSLSLGLSYVACTTPQQQSQLATLHERLNQMISAIYSSPLLSKVKASASSEEVPTSSQESAYLFPPEPAPQVVYVSPPSYLETSPSDYGYPITTNPVSRTSWPYSYEYSSYQPQFSPPVYSPPILRPPYPEYAQLPVPQSAALPPPYPSVSPYGSPFPPAQYLNSGFQYPMTKPGYSVAPPLPAPYPLQMPYPPVSFPLPISSTSFPASYPTSYPPSMLNPPPAPAPYSLPQQYAQSLPYPAPVSTPYPLSFSMPYLPSFPYPQPLYSSPAFPKPSEILPQPQYEYSSLNFDQRN